MPKSPNEILEARAAFEAEVSKLETRIDAQLDEKFESGTRVDVHLGYTPKPEVVARVKADYEAVGWKVVFEEHTGMESGWISRFLFSAKH
jgi:hypothetical protein